MFRALICPSSGVWDYVVEIPASAGSPDTNLAEPHHKYNTQHSKNNTANVVFQQHSRKIPEDGHINARNMLSI